MNIVTLTSDFGTRDWFVASMKGVILSINPQTTIVDITHEVPAGDIRAGAFALAMSYRCFPRLTVHMAVVDPGVGTERAAIAVRTADYFFLAPDNGLLSLALARESSRNLPRGKRFVLPQAGQQHVSRTRHFRARRGPVGKGHHHGHAGRETQ